MLRAPVRLILFVALAALLSGAVTTAANPPLPHMEPGVTVMGVKISGLTAEQARARIRRAFEQPLRFGFYKRRWTATPEQLGVRADLGGAIEHALDAKPGEPLSLGVYIPRSKLRRYVSYLDRTFSRPVRDAELQGLSGDLTPVISDERPGRKVRTELMAKTIVERLTTGSRASIPLRLKPLVPKVTDEDFGPVLVIRRGSNQLYLYEGANLVRSFRVATGQAAYPTPLGQWSIVDMQRDPWWRPPPSDWAKDAKPIPPGPGNPLGTRWMGLSAPAVGIHGTPDSASVGYSASHGCIRMLIPEAAWLFDHVEIGAPVFIVSS